MRRLPARSRYVLPALLLIVGCTSPEQLLKLQEQLTQAADAVNDLHVTVSAMQITLDSLATVVAKQDTTIARLANATGVQVVK